MSTPDDPTLSPDEDNPAPDAWAEADRAYAAKWADAPPDDPPVDDAPRRASARPATPASVADSYLDGMQAAGPYLGLGIQIAVSMVLFCGGGYAVDRWLGTSPWGLLVGAVLGMAGIVALLVRVSNEAARTKPKR